LLQPQKMIFASKVTLNDHPASLILIPEILLWVQLSVLIDSRKLTEMSIQIFVFLTWDVT
jgi:hypothetical protein